MGISLAMLAGKRAISMRITVPAWGAWYADAVLDAEETLTGPVRVELADLSLSGTVLSGGPSGDGRSAFRVVGGRGGWGRTIPAASYANDLGVRASQIVQDAAAACGEQVGATLPTSRVGAAFVRQQGPAGRVLEQLFPRGWYVDGEGVTQLGQRPPSTLAASVVHGPVDRARGCVTLASETIASILPGLVVDGLSVVDVLHEATAEGGLRSTVWGTLAASSTSRRLEALRKLHEQLDPLRSFRAVWEYRVVGQSGKRLSLVPVRVSTGMPSLDRVLPYPGAPGAEGVLQLGSRVLVGFIDSDPSRPYVCAFEDAEGVGFIPTTITLTASSHVDVGGSGAAALAKSSPTTGAINALGTWVAACTAALAASPTYTLFQAAMVAPGATVAAALPALVAAVPTSIARGK